MTFSRLLNTLSFTKLQSVLSVLATVSLLSSCVYYSGPYDGDRNTWFNERGSGNTITEQRPVNNIHSVELDNQGDLFIVLGDSESLFVEADDNLLPLIRTEVRDGKLQIYNDGRRHFRSFGRIRYTLTVKSLTSISIGSTGNVNAPDLSADHFKISVNSTGNLSMGSLEAGNVELRTSSTGDIMLRRVDAEHLDVSISSTGHVAIRSGAVKNQEIRISSTGNYDAIDIDSDVALVKLNSTGSAYVTVNEYLEASLNSTGSLHYRGAAKTNIIRNSSGRAILLGQR